MVLLFRSASERLDVVTKAFRCNLLLEKENFGIKYSDEKTNRKLRYDQVYPGVIARKSHSHTRSLNTNANIKFL